MQAETASDLQGSPTGAIGDDIMNCCGPKTSAPADKARDIPKATETPKAEGSACCGGGGGHKADAATLPAGKDAPAGAAHQH